MSIQKATTAATRQINAVVVSAGLMEKTVKVRIGTQKWNNHIRKKFNNTTHLLVHDPRSSLRIGDIISISPGWRVSKHVHHVVSSIVAPFGEPIEARAPVPTEEERIAERVARQKEKDLRRGKWWRWPGEKGSERTATAEDVLSQVREKEGQRERIRA